MGLKFDTGDYVPGRGGDNVKVNPRALLVGGQPYPKWNWSTNLCRSGKPPIDEELKSLARDMKPKPQRRPDNIEEMTSGQLEPIIVRILSNRQLEVVAGFRRLLAADWLIESGECPDYEITCAPPRTMNDAEAALINVSENIHRLAPKPIEWAHAIRSLKEDHQLPIKDIAGRLKIQQSRISQLLAVLTLPDDIQKDVVDGNTSMNAAIELTKAGDNRAQREVFNELKATGGKKVKAAEVKAANRKNAEAKGETTKSRRNLKDLRAFLLARSGEHEDPGGIRVARSLLSFVDGVITEKKASNVWEAFFPTPVDTDETGEGEEETGEAVVETSTRKKRAAS